MTDDSGRIRAERVTGPMGAFVQGAPRRDFGRSLGGGGGGFGFGSGGDGGFGGGGFGGGGFGGGRRDDAPRMPSYDDDDHEESSSSSGFGGSGSGFGDKKD